MQSAVQPPFAFLVTQGGTSTRFEPSSNLYSIPTTSWCNITSDILFPAKSVTNYLGHQVCITGNPKAYVKAQLTLAVAELPAKGLFFFLTDAV